MTILDTIESRVVAITGVTDVLHDTEQLTENNCTGIVAVVSYDAGFATEPRTHNALNQDYIECETTLDFGVSLYRVFTPASQLYGFDSHFSIGQPYTRFAWDTINIGSIPIESLTLTTPEECIDFAASEATPTATFAPTTAQDNDSDRSTYVTATFATALQAGAAWTAHGDIDSAYPSAVTVTANFTGGQQLSLALTAHSNYVWEGRTTAWAAGNSSRAAAAMALRALLRAGFSNAKPADGLMIVPTSSNLSYEPGSRLVGATINYTATFYETYGV